MHFEYFRLDTLTFGNKQFGLTNVQLVKKRIHFLSPSLSIPYTEQITYVRTSIKSCGLSQSEYTESKKNQQIIALYVQDAMVAKPNVCSID